MYRKLWFHLIKPSINRIPAPNLRILKNQFCSPVKKKSLLNQDTFNFLGKSESLSKIG
jgi:hypothetical protein